MRNFILIVYNWAIVWKRQFCRMQALSQFYGCKHYTLLHRDKKTCKKTQDLSNKKSWVGEIVRQRYSISLNLNAYSLSNKHDLSTHFLLRRKPSYHLSPVFSKASNTMMKIRVMFDGSVRTSSYLSLNGI